MILLENRLYKVIVGLALEAETYNRRLNQKLSDIYSNPTLDAIKTLHDRLIVSDDYPDREVALWLELALDQAPAKVDLIDLTVELNEIEILLSDLLWQVEADSQRDLNDWLNYVSNVPQSIQHGFVIDAKMLMNLAVQYSTTDSVERNKKNLSMGYKIELLQKETLRLFEEIKKIPIKLTIPEERIGALIELQRILIDMLRKYYLERVGNATEDIIRYPIQRLEEAQKHLMRPEIEVDKVRQEMKFAYENLESQARSDISDKRLFEWMGNIKERIKAASERLP